MGSPPDDPVVNVIPRQPAGFSLAESGGRTRYSQHVSTTPERLSEEELFELACRPRDPGGRPQVEFLGAYTIEEALEMGAWFDDPDEQAAFERAVEARGLRLP